MADASLLALGALRRLAPSLALGPCVVYLPRFILPKEFVDGLGFVPGVSFTPLDIDPLTKALKSPADVWAFLGREAGVTEGKEALVAKGATYLGHRIFHPRTREEADVFLAVMEEWRGLQGEGGYPATGLTLTWSGPGALSCRLPIHIFWPDDGSHVCRALALAKYSYDDPRHAWFVEHIAGFSGGDIGLAAVLAEKWTGGEAQELAELLGAFEKDVGLPPKSALMAERFNPLSSLLENFTEQWFAGQLVKHPLEGWEWHPSLLGFPGRDFNHRLWRCQIPLVLGLMDRIRLAAIEHLIDTYGREWTRWVTGTLVAKDWQTELALVELESDPYRAEVGWLVNLREGGTYQGPFAVKSSRIQGALSVALQARNDLIHKGPITFQNYRELCDGFKNCLKADLEMVSKST